MHLMSDILQMIRDTMLYSKEVKQETNRGHLIGTMNFDPG